jgi:hypothetical protein
MFFPGNRQQRFIHLPGKRCQFGPSFNAKPKHSRRPRRREKAMPPKMNFEGSRPDGTKLTLDILDALNTLLADKFQSHM